MKIRALKSAVISLSLALSISNIAWANQINTQALELAGQQKFDQALTLLSGQDAELKAGYEHRFLKARILSWAGQYSKARAELNALMAEYPDNPDLQLTIGNLEYYQGNLDAAETQYQWVLSRFPDYQDARNGLENVRKAKAAKASNGEHDWRIDGSVGLSDFDRSDLSNWNDQFLRVEYSPETIAYHASVQRYKRFGTTDIELQGGIADAVRGGWDWGLEAGVTPNETFRPKFSVGTRLGKALEISDEIVIYPNVTYRFDDYAAADIHNIQPGIITYLDNGVILTGRLIATLQDQEDDQLGWLLEGRAPVTDRLQLRAGYANAPEAVDGVAITTQSLFGGLTYNVQDNLDLHINLARDDREDSFIRNSANVGFTYKR